MAQDCGLNLGKLKGSLAKSTGRTGIFDSGPSDRDLADQIGSAHILIGAVDSGSSGWDRLDARSGGAGRRNWRSAAARCRSNAQARSRPRFGLGWHARDKGKLLTGSGRSTASGAGSPTAGWHGGATAHDGEQN